MAIETWMKDIVSISGLLAVVSMACLLKIKSTTFVSKRLSDKFGKLWLAAEVILFVLVGAAVDIRYTLNAGGAAILMILVALLFRSVGVAICLIRTRLTKKNGYSVSFPIFQRLPFRLLLALFRLLWDSLADRLSFPLQF